ncbi:MAG TPA: ChaN family lipoprotein, partial [Casimicrobiaceae bacterium]|nr:ChaN family lipoprotein [Casimicrobiaceae bacterium]
LLGEKHDDPEHHRLRADLIESIVRAGQRPAVVFEQFDLGNDASIAAAQAGNADAEQLADAGKLDRRAWLWPMHKALIDAVLALHLPVHAGNASSAALERVLRRGEPPADPRWASRLDSAVWSQAQADALRKEIVESHCNQLPDSVVPRLVLAQRTRDAAMAQALIDSANADGAILLAGNGHVRRDLGVPVYLTGIDAASILSVGFIEVSDEDRRAADFPRNVARDEPGFDIMVLTGKVDRGDPCEAMKQFRRAPAAK